MPDLTPGTAAEVSVAKAARLEPPCTVRASMLLAADKARQILSDKEIRWKAVTLRTRTWDGAAAGLGTASDVDVVLNPRPRIREVGVDFRASPAGLYEAGDLIVDELSSILYTRATLTGEGITSTQLFFWVVDGADYVVKRVSETMLGWRVVLKRRRG